MITTSSCTTYWIGSADVSSRTTLNFRVIGFRNRHQFTIVHIPNVFGSQFNKLAVDTSAPFASKVDRLSSPFRDLTHNTEYTGRNFISRVSTREESSHGIVRVDIQHPNVTLRIALQFLRVSGCNSSLLHFLLRNIQEILGLFLVPVQLNHYLCIRKTLHDIQKEISNRKQNAISRLRQSKGKAGLTITKVAQVRQLHVAKLISERTNFGITTLVNTIGKNSGTHFFAIIKSTDSGSTNVSKQGVTQ